MAEDLRPVLAIIEPNPGSSLEAWASATLMPSLRAPRFLMNGARYSRFTSEFPGACGFFAMNEQAAIHHWDHLQKLKGLYVAKERKRIVGAWPLWVAIEKGTSGLSFPY